MKLQEYLKTIESEFSTQDILYALSDGEFLSKFNSSKEEVEEMYEYYLNKLRGIK